MHVQLAVAIVRVVHVIPSDDVAPAVANPVPDVFATATNMAFAGDQHTPVQDAVDRVLVLQVIPSIDVAA